MTYVIYHMGPGQTTVKGEEPSYPLLLQYSTVWLALGASSSDLLGPHRPPPGLMWTAVCRPYQLIISAAFAPSRSVYWDTPTYWKCLGKYWPAIGSPQLSG
ncbi:hypothetical protein HispidOSU_021798, partial [Sigmodon hispidus]